MGTILYQRIKELCEENKISIRKLEDDLGMGHAHIVKFNGSRSPNLTSLEKIAAYFNVSIDYLIGRTDIQNLPDNPNNDVLSFQRAYARSDPERQQEMMNVLKIAFRDEFKEDDKK